MTHVDGIRLFVDSEAAVYFLSNGRFYIRNAAQAAARIVFDFFSTRLQRLLLYQANDWNEVQILSSAALKIVSEYWRLLNALFFFLRVQTASLTT